MSRAEKIIRQVIEELSPRQGEVVSGGTYEDEPILRTGRQLLEAQLATTRQTQRLDRPRLPQQEREASLSSSKRVPSQIKAMRALAKGRGRQRGYYQGGAELFFKQAVLMEDYTDDCPFTGNFVSYYPTYESMPDQVLRGYFCWRTRFRKGRTPRAPLAFLFVHIYELLCGVGVTPGEDGLRELTRIYHAYHEDLGCRALESYLPHWMRDYAIYHGLDLSSCESADLMPSSWGHALRAVSVLRQAQEALLSQKSPALWDDATPELPPVSEFISALEEVSAYHIAKSRAMRLHASELEEILCAIFAHLVDHCRRRRKTSFVDGLFGLEYSYPYLMFSSAVFWEREPHPDVTVKLPTGETYLCKDSRWWVASPCDERLPSRGLGLILHTADRLLREHAGDLPSLKPRKAPKYLLKIVDEEVTACLERREAIKAAQVHIDRSKLGGIRVAAGRTREALLVDEEREEREELAPYMRSQLAPTNAAATVGEGQKSPSPELGLTPGPSDGASCPGAVVLTTVQRQILRGLLDGSLDVGALEQTGIMVSLETDMINERFLDLVGDTVIEVDEDAPHLVEDYVEDVREVLL